MANPNISFYRQTTGATTKGAITFDTTNKYIYLGDGTTAHKFNCNNATYSGHDSYGISVSGNGIYQTRPRISGTASGGKLGSLNLSAQLNTLLEEWYESSPQGCLCVTVTIESSIINANWVDGNHIVGTAHLVFPAKSSLLSYVDSTSSDRSDNVYLFSTPFIAATGASGVGQCVLKVLYGGSATSSTWHVHSVAVVNATSPTTRVDSNSVVSIGYEIRAWKTL